MWARDLGHVLRIEGRTGKPARISAEPAGVTPYYNFRISESPSHPPYSSPVIIPDVHGACALLHAALRHFPERTFVFLGDLIDRGPDSRGVLRTTSDLFKRG